MSQEEKSIENDEPSEAQQAARANLRESFLHVLNTFTGQRCKILTYENTNLQATFVAWNPESQDVLVHDMTTPANVCIKSAVLRPTDILSIEFQKK